MSEAGSENVGWLPTRWLLVLAILLPGPVAGLIASAIIIASGFSDLAMSEGYRPEHLVLLGGGIGATWGLIPMLMFGLPMHLWLRTRTRAQVWQYAASGMFGGAVTGGLFALPLLTTGPSNQSAQFGWFILAGLAAGSAAGTGFWLIRRPDRDAVSASPTP